MNRLPVFPALFLILFGVISCQDEGKTTRLEVRLTDSPGDYEELNVDILGVEIHSSGGNPTTGWQSLEVSAKIYNLLEFTNGLDTLLGTIDLPAGHISQLRLVLGTNNNVKINGNIFPLSTPSGQQSGLKLNLDADLLEGITYTLLIDFDAARSVVETGGGNYILKPVIRAISEATSGAIAGAVEPVESSPAVYAISGADTVATTFATDAGDFFLQGVPAGTYTVSFAPKTGFQTTSVPGVVVTLGNITEMDTVTINP